MGRILYKTLLQLTKRKLSKTQQEIIMKDSSRILKTWKVEATMMTKKTGMMMKEELKKIAKEESKDDDNEKIEEQEEKHCDNDNNKSCIVDDVELVPESFHFENSTRQDSTSVS